MNVRTSTTYYVVVVDGMPQAVSTIAALANSWAKELGSKNRAAMVVPAISVDPDYLDEDEFVLEPDTLKEVHHEAFCGLACKCNERP